MNTSNGRFPHSSSLRPRHGVAGALLVAALAWLGTDSSAQAQEPRTAVWVFFTDKGPAQGLDLALMAREHELPARTLARRRKARGDRGVDHRDLPVAADYLANVEATGATVRAHSRWLNAVSVDATAAQRTALAALPHVDHVEPVRRHARRPAPVLTSPTDPSFGGDEFGWSSAQLELIGAINLQRHCGLTGAGVVVGVQDTGFDLNHQAFDSVNVLAAHDFINDDDIVANEPGDPNNQANHGTLVLGTLAGSDPGTFMGVAPGIDVILSKTERTDAEIPAEEDYYVEGLEWIEAQGADIFTASLGYIDWYSPNDLDGQTAVSTIAVNTAFDNGLAVFASMGNSGPGPSTIIAPADAFGALGIGATTLAGSVANFSSRGPTADGRTKPDVSAPGVDVASVELGTTDQYSTWNGTSAAAPVAAGLAALVLEARPTLTAQELADLLRDTASQPNSPNNSIGWGIVNGERATGEVCGCNDIDEDGHVGLLCGGDDCNDSEDNVQPGAEEICDGLDSDCDGAPGPDETDADGDGVMACAGDCQDDDPDINPYQPEICGDGIDNDCREGDEPCPVTTGPDSGGESTSGGGGGSGTPPPPLDDTGTLPGGTGTDTGAPADDPATSSEGCGCQAPAQRGGPASALLLLILAGLRRRQPRTSDIA